MHPLASQFQLPITEHKRGIAGSLALISVHRETMASHPLFNGWLLSYTFETMASVADHTALN